MKISNKYKIVLKDKVMKFYKNESTNYTYNGKS